uniref:Uncharacterized protein n=1 Tax=Timema monikensis TaxID=170555 RepID=A0A7R9EJU1_9NEOP|nr:unnamed protein product [Timema monikensis]
MLVSNRRPIFSLVRKSNRKEQEIIERQKRTLIQVCRHSVFQAPGFNLDQSDLGSKRAYIKIGLYRGNIVAIKKVYKRHIDITRNIRKELKQNTLEIIVWWCGSQRTSVCGGLLPVGVLFEVPAEFSQDSKASESI